MAIEQVGEWLNLELSLELKRIQSDQVQSGYGWYRSDLGDHQLDHSGFDPSTVLFWDISRSIISSIGSELWYWLSEFNGLLKKYDP